MKMEIKASNTFVHQDLIDRCKLGDQKAQMQIYKLYYRAMYNTSLNILGDTAEAEDIMQESFLKAFSLLPGMKLESSFGGWLKKIVVNKSLDALRKRKVQFEDVENIKYERIEEYSYEEQEEDIMDKLRKVKKALADLPEKYRTVLSLNLIEGYDHEEISSLLGITPSTSRAQLSRGKQKLLAILKN